MSVSPVCQDRVRRPRPDAVQMTGPVGQRFDASRINRLRAHEDSLFLWPFQEHCPVGIHHPDRPHPEITRGDWQGEFLGTWIDTAVLAAWNKGDEALRTKTDAVVRDWLTTQAEDGYLGTYDEADRWQSWDVWVQAHDLIGLLSYHAYTGNEAALHAAIRVADRVLQDFGPGRRFLHTGPHGGMASSAILEPMVWLAWTTGDRRYLDFGRWLVDEDWEAAGGAAISSSLLAGRGVARTGTAKAAEMLICFTGMVELYRATGEDRYLTPVLIAWQDIVEHHLYLTGSASTGEHFFADYALRNDGLFQLGETCVTMTWLYLNLSLGRLTGEARFWDMVEQTLYNHLLAAQSPDGRGWAYYLGLRDSKRYRWHTDPDCCPSRGARALAQLPQHVFGITAAGVAVNFYEPAAAALPLPSGAELRLVQAGAYPFDGAVRLTLDLAASVAFELRLRVPGWCKAWQVRLNGVAHEAQPDASGYLVLDRVWAPGDAVELEMVMPPRVIADTLGNQGRAALMRGPVVYAAERANLPAGRLLDDVILWLDAAEPARDVRIVAGSAEHALHLVVPTAVVQPRTGATAWRTRERYYDLATSGEALAGESLELVPFFQAGNRDPASYRDGIHANTEPVTEITFQVWLPYLGRHAEA